MISYSLVNDYSAALKAFQKDIETDIASELFNNLPDLWIEDYKLRSKRLTDIGIIKYGSFYYIFDDYGSLERKGIVPYSPIAESRIIAVYGFSSPQKIKRDDYRLRGWLGKTEQLFGKDWDKGHCIAHSLGGAINGIEINVFQQRRDLNRGWSAQGKVFRKMETYCFENAETFCFNRFIYPKEGVKPSFHEFGLLKQDNTFWSELFDNR